MNFAKQTLVVAMGTGGAQLIMLVATPWLARAYTPFAFGEFAVFQSVMMALVTVSCLRYEMAIPVEKRPEQANLLSVLSILSVLVVAFLSLGATVAIQYGVLPFNLGSLGPSLIYIPAAILFSGLFQVTTFLGIREGNFLHTGMFKVGQAIFFVVSALLLGGLGLVGAYAFSFAFAAISLLRYIGNISAFSFRDLLGVAKRYKEYPLLSMPTALLDTLALAAPVLIISEYYSTTDTGNFSQVQRLISAPLLLLSMAISQVFFKHASEYRHSGKLLVPLMVRAIRILGVAGITLWLTAAAIGNPLLRLILGSEWRTDTAFILLAITPIVIRVMVSPVSNIFMVCDRVRLGTMWQVFHFAAAFGVLPIAAKRMGFDNFLLVIVVSDLVLYTLYGTLALRVARQADGEIR